MPHFNPNWRVPIFWSILMKQLSGGQVMSSNNSPFVLKEMLMIWVSIHLLNTGMPCCWKFALYHFTFTYISTCFHQWKKIWRGFVVLQKQGERTAFNVCVMGAWIEGAHTPSSESDTAKLFAGEPHSALEGRGPAPGGPHSCPRARETTPDSGPEPSSPDSVSPFLSKLVDGTRWQRYAEKLQR
mgnify:CR=1 FL=1